jgi:hypothetical protein
MPPWDPRAAAGWLAAGVRRLWDGFWPGAFLLLALALPFVRGRSEYAIVFAQFVVLLAFGATAIGKDLRGLPDAARRRAGRPLVVAPMVVLAVYLALGSVGVPFEAEDRESRASGIAVLVAGGLTALCGLVLWLGPRRRPRLALGRITIVAGVVPAFVTCGIVFFYLHWHAVVAAGTWRVGVWTFFVLADVVVLARAVAYADNPRRRVVGFIVVWTLAWWIARTFWTVTAASPGVKWIDWITIGALALLLLLLVRDGQQEQADGDGTGASPYERGLGRGSLYLTALAIAALTGASILATVGRRTVSAPEGVAIGSAEPLKLDIRAMAGNGKAFAATFSPVLLFPSSGHLEPVRVAEYIGSGRASATWIDDSPIPGRSDQVLGARCPPGLPTPCKQVTIDCPASRSAESGCDEEIGFHAEASGAGRQARTAPVYVRIVELNTFRGVRKSGRFRIRRAGPFDELEWIAQYWYFYSYDHWTAETLFGTLEQSHEGDWEAITIGFSDRSPLFVAFSEHCGGTWQRWEDVEIVRGPSAEVIGEGWHPVALVGAGSQAMYPGLDADVSPDWANCLGIGARELSLVTVGLNIREHLGSDVVVASGRHEVVRVAEADFPMSFPGRWGAENGEVTFTTELGRSRTPRRTERPPLTPTQQPLWTQPLSRIFCSPAWQPRECPA